MKINSYEDNKNSVNMTFSEKASNVSIVMKKGKKGTPVEIVSKKNVSSKDATLTFKSSLLKKGCDVCVKAKDEETGAWHLYRLKNVLVVEEIPEDGMVDYSQELAEQCALYSALAYKWKSKDDGFTYDVKNSTLSVMEPDEEKCEYIELDKKMERDGFTVLESFMFQNYGDKEEDNCSFSIAHTTQNGKKYVYVVIRGTDGVEWYGNMKCNGMNYVSGMEDHYSFKNGIVTVKNSLLNYLSEFKIHEAQIVVTGHSRGAAVANLLAKDLIDDSPNITIGKTKRIESVCAYTFATPNCTKDKDVSDKKYSSIFNFCLEDDFVPQVPLKDWGYDKYGIPFSANSEVVSCNNSEYVEFLNGIRGDDIRTAYNAQATKELKEHIFKYWKSVYEYYEKNYKIHSVGGKITLYEYMHNVLAGIMAGETLDQIKGGGMLVFPMLDFDKLYESVEVNVILSRLGLKKARELDKGDLLILLSLYCNIFRSPELYNEYNNVYGKISEYFFVGSNVKIPLICQEYVFSTHKPDNYYALLLAGGFNTNEKKVNINSKKYNSRNAENVSEISQDAVQFRKTLNQTVKVQTEDGEIQEKTVAEVLGWNIDDTATWDGVVFKDGRIISITLNQSEFQNLTLDLTGLDKLEDLYCVFTGFKEIILKGCTSLKTVTALHNRIETIDVSDCGNLTELDIRYNQLEKITLGEHKDIQRFDCNGNYLDIDSDETFLRMICQVKENGGTSNYEGQMCQKDATYSQTDMQVIQKLLQTEDNAEKLGWEPDDIDTWSGVEWKTVSGVNYIRAISISSEKLKGELDVTALKYLQSLDCSGNEFTSVNISGCKKLSSLFCYECRLTVLKLDGADELLYLDCEGNYLDISEIEEACKKIQEKEESSVSYEHQYILAGREAFNEEECSELERFAKYGKNNEYLGWDMSQPGLSRFLTWVSVDGEYRLSEINLLGADVSGELDLSRFKELKKICMIATDIEKVTLPDGLAVLDEKAFLNCQKLQEATLPDGLEEIGEWAFKGCISLKKMTFRGDAPKVIGEEAFDEVSGEMELCYDQSKNGWDAGYWKQFHLTAIAEPSMPTEIPGTVTPEPTATKEPAGTGADDGMHTENGYAASAGAGFGKQAGTVGTSQTGDGHQVPKIKITKIKRQKGKITVILKRMKKVGGYEVYFRKGKKGKYKVRKSKGWKKNKIILKKLKRNSIYFVKARAYKVVGRKKYYSAFTKEKKVKVK